MEEDFFNTLKKIKAIADIGLVYSSSDEYNKERYIELRELAIKLMAELTNIPFKTYQNFYEPVLDYPTPKVDVRALIINDQKEILLVQEKTDGNWTLPGGWADIGLTPSESVLKEIKEEIGRSAKVDKLIAVFDKKMHPHPPQPFYVYKMVFLCSFTDNTESFATAFDTMDIQYFSINALPSLSKDRILECQIKMLYSHVENKKHDPICD